MNAPAGVAQSWTVRTVRDTVTVTVFPDGSRQYITRER